jgi:hypothetical protein
MFRCAKNQTLDLQSLNIYKKILKELHFPRPWIDENTLTFMDTKKKN